MATIAVLAGTPKWYVLNLCGRPAVGGFFETADALTGEPKPTYADPGLTQENPTRMRIDSDGAVDRIMYFKVVDDEPLYTITARDADGSLIYQVENFPVVNGSGGGGDIYISINAVNYGRNEQFAFWNRGTSFNGSTLPVGTTEIADDWFFKRSNSTANITIAKYNFSAGSTDFDFSPTSALRYTVSTASSDSSSDVLQRYLSVQTLNNQQITVQIGAKELNVGQTAPLTLYYRQHFGAGGSADVTATVETFTVTDTSDVYTATFTIPSIGGKTIGSGGDDYLEIGYRLNPNLTQDVILTNYQFQQGEGTGINYPYITEDEQYVKIFPDVMQGYSDTQGTNKIGWSADQTLKEFLVATTYEMQKGNFLIGWDFAVNPNQFGETINTVPNATYIADQTILLSDGNGVVNKSSFIGSPLTLTVNTASKKFGILQIIETANSVDLRGQVASLACQVEADSEQIFKIAVLKWTGTQDQQTKSAVQAWNSVGTDPTLSAGWAYASEVFEFKADTDTADNVRKLENQTLDSASSYGVLLWNDTPADSSTCRIIRASLTLGQNATLGNTLDLGTTLIQCQRYLTRSYTWNTATASGAITSNLSYQFPINAYVEPVVASDFLALIYPVNVSTNQRLFVSAQTVPVTLPVEMYAAPTVTLYNPYTGTAGQIRVRLQSAPALSSGSENIATSAVDITTSEFALSMSQNILQFGSSGSIASVPTGFVHFVAQSLLGV